MSYPLAFKAPNITIAEFANTVDSDEMAHNEASHLDLQCLPSSLLVFNIIQFELKIILEILQSLFSRLLFQRCKP